MLHKHDQISTGNQNDSELTQNQQDPGKILKSGKVPRTSELEGTNHPEHPNYYEYQDLYQQTSMADSTRAIVRLTKISLVLGFFGSIAIIWTLLEARKANALAGRTMSLENRPWLHIDPQIASDLRLTERGGSITLAVKYQNIGSSPAQNVQVYCGEVAFGTDRIHEEIERVANGFELQYREDREWGFSESVFPGAGHMDHVQALHSQEIIDAESGVYRDGVLRIAPVFVVVIYYTSVLGNDIYSTRVATGLSKPNDLGGNSSIEISGDTQTIDGKGLLLSMYPKTFSAT